MIKYDKINKKLIKYFYTLEDLKWDNLKVEIF